MKIKTRQTFAKRVAAKKTVAEKLEAAAGENLSCLYNFSLGDPSLFATVRRVRWLASELQRHGGSGLETRYPKQLALTFMNVGIMAVSAIAARDPKFFDRMAAILRHDIKPSHEPLYAAILSYCYDNGHTQARPCEPRKLYQHLMAHRFFRNNFSMRGGVPRELLALCKKLGVPLAKKPTGRPRKNERK
jgi:hypothetical protein